MTCSAIAGMARGDRGLVGLTSNPLGIRAPAFAAGERGLPRPATGKVFGWGGRLRARPSRRPCASGRRRSPRAEPARLRRSLQGSPLPVELEQGEGNGGLVPGARDYSGPCEGIPRRRRVCTLGRVRQPARHRGWLSGRLGQGRVEAREGTRRGPLAVGCRVFAGFASRGGGPALLMRDNSCRRLGGNAQGTPAALDRLADLLSRHRRRAARSAWRACRRISRPVDLAEAYAAAGRGGRAVGGKRVTGRSSGGSSAPPPRRCRNTSAFPNLRPARCWRANCHLGPARLARKDFLNPGVECEIAVRLGADLPPEEAPFTERVVGKAVQAAMASIELVDPAGRTSAPSTWPA